MRRVGIFFIALALLINGYAIEIATGRLLVNVEPEASFSAQEFAELDFVHFSARFSQSIDPESVTNHESGFSSLPS